MLASFSSLSPGRGLEVGVSIVDPRGEPFAPLLITARASEIESSEGGWKERSSSSESSRQMVSGAGVQIELFGALTDVLEFNVVAQVEVTKDAQVFCSFFGLESWKEGIRKGKTIKSHHLCQSRSTRLKCNAMTLQMKCNSSVRLLLKIILALTKSTIGSTQDPQVNIRMK